LKQKDDIVFYEQLVLMEDELADNGTCIESAKVRVMTTGFFCLHRMLLRVDDVVATINDTRLYHEFGTNVVFHEFSVRSSTYEQLKRAGKYPHNDPAQLGDENFLYESLEKVSLVTRQIKLK
jgi:type 2A phosphatase activator TIP41